MTWRMSVSSLRKNRIVTVLMAAFLALSAALLGGAMILTLGVVGTVDGFMETARTPHFMQMHLGDLDVERLGQWAAGRDEIETLEVIEYLNVENSHLTFAGTPLDLEIQQNGFVTQPERLDHLLSPSGDRPEPRPGEVYVPLFYESKYDLSVGDSVSVATPAGPLELEVAGTFRDSQMNSTLASSKRLLVSHSDWAELRARLGVEPEHLISFRLQEPAQAGALEAAYYDAGLETNGPALSWSLFRLINTINDGVTVLLLILMAAIVLLITLLCIRYTLLATLEEDLSEIGVMKALGVANRRIAAIYLGKYRVLLGAGSLAGLGLALLARGAILANLQRTMGEVNNPLLGLLAAAGGVLLLYLACLAMVRRVLRRLRVVSPLHALSGRSDLVTRKLRPRSLLGNGGMRPRQRVHSRRSGVNAKAAWAAVRSAPGAHGTTFGAALLIMLALLVPFRIGATARSPSFVTYMGIGQYDVRVDLLTQDDPVAAANSIAAALEGDARVSRFETYLQRVVTTISPAGRRNTMRVDFGEHSTYPLRYSQGRAPTRRLELGLSAINAESLGVKVGEELVIDSPGGLLTMTVTGTYQDITNGGKTAKAIPHEEWADAADGQRAVAMLALSLAPGADSAALAVTVRSVVPTAKVIDTGTYVTQMLGDIIRVMDRVAWTFAVVSVLLAALIAALFVRLMLVRERRPNAVMQALGFTGTDLRLQYLLRVLLPVALGGLLGVALASPIGNLIGNGIFATVGVSGLVLAFDLPMTLIGGGAVLLSAWLATHLTTARRTGTNLARALRA